MATEIIYSGAVIGTVDAGQSKIIKCKGKRMKGDVEIRAGERTEIKYNGAVIATVEAGESETLKCAGKIMKTDIEIEVKERKILLQEIVSVMFTSNGVTEILPGEGYDGLKGVRAYVDVPSESVEEYDGTVVIE